MLQSYSLPVAMLAVIFFGSGMRVNAAPAPAWATAPGIAQTATLTLNESILFALDRDPAVSQPGRSVRDWSGAD